MTKHMIKYIPPIVATLLVGLTMASGGKKDQPKAVKPVGLVGPPQAFGKTPKIVYIDSWEPTPSVYTDSCQVRLGDTNCALKQ